MLLDGSRSTAVETHYASTDPGKFPTKLSLSFLLNPNVDRVRSYGDAERAVISLREYERAAVEIRAWPDHGPSPLHSLPALARELGVRELCLKDESERFNLGSFIGNRIEAAKPETVAVLLNIRSAFIDLPHAPKLIVTDLSPVIFLRICWHIDRKLEA